jgi:DNA polymerase III subunit epsilon
MTFTAIDFETATGCRNSACAIGVVCVENGEIVETYSALMQPPGNAYWRGNIAVHGISPSHTADAPVFAELFPRFRHLLEGRLLVAHNAPFDRSVLAGTMKHFNLDYENLRLPGWDCTLKIYRAKGFKPCRLSDCCNRLNISLNHHEALSDAIGCAHLYLRAGCSQP